MRDDDLLALMMLTFVCIGCLLAVDGHSDAQIKLEGHDEAIDYRNFVAPAKTAAELESRVESYCSCDFESSQRVQNEWSDDTRRNL